MSTDHLLIRLRPLLADRYRFETYLGRGGSASVYTVTNLRLDRREAFKVLSESQQGNDEFTERFANEAKLAASLDHPNIVKVYDFGDLEGICWFSMQLIEGPSLSTEAHTRGSFDAASVIQLSLPLLDALGFSHRRGIVHRDVKPSNIILDQNGRPYLMDFGIAKSSGSMLETRTGLVLGTPAYVAPEQASGMDIDGRADIYAFGVTMYQMLSGEYPFTADSPLQSVVLRMTQDAEPLRDKVQDIHPRLHEIVMKALARDPDLRYETAIEMKKDLEHLQHDVGACPRLDPQSVSPGQGRPLVFPENTDIGVSPTIVATSGSEANELRWMRRKRHVRLATWISGTAALVLLAVLFILGLDDRGAETQEPVANPSLSESSSRIAPATATPTATLPVAPEPPAGATPAATEPTPEPPRPSPTPLPSKPTPRPYLRPAHMPKLIADPKLQLPDELGACLGEKIRLSFFVATNGHVEATKVISTGHPPGCAEYALTTVQQWLYEPALDIEGTAVRAPMSVAFEISEVADDS